MFANIASITLAAAGVVYVIGATAWGAGAMYFDAGQRSKWSWPLVIGWLLVVAGVFWLIQPFGLAVLVFSALLVAMLSWWLSQQPTHDRRWDPNFAELPELEIDGDKIVVRRLRNTQYRTLDDFDVHYETRSYRLSNLCGVDMLILYWGSPYMCHPMAIFDFGDDGHLCFSIEVRYRYGEKYDLVRSIYRQNELMYVVSDERDAILRRTKYSVNHECYLYRLRIDQDHFVEDFS